MKTENKNKWLEELDALSIKRVTQTTTKEEAMKTAKTALEAVVPSLELASLKLSTVEGMPEEYMETYIMNLIEQCEDAIDAINQSTNNNNNNNQQPTK